MRRRDCLVGDRPGAPPAPARILFRCEGASRHVARGPSCGRSIRARWVEHDPEEIWRGVVATCREAIAASPGPVAAIGIHQPARNHRTVGARDRPARITTRSSGRTGAPQTSAERWRSDGPPSRWRSALGSSSTRISRRRRYAGCSDEFARACRARPRRGVSRSARSIRFLLWRLSGGRLHATRRYQRLAHDVLRPSTASPGTMNCSPVSASPRRCCRKSTRQPAAIDRHRQADLLGQAIPIAGVGAISSGADRPGLLRPGMAKSTYGKPARSRCCTPVRRRPARATAC